MLRFNLYFKNLPNGTTEEDLKEYFGQFGEIKSLKLMRKRVPAPLESQLKEESKIDEQKFVQGESLGFGFVSYTTIEAASRARSESKSKPLKGQMIFVS